MRIPGFVRAGWASTTAIFTFAALIPIVYTAHGGADDDSPFLTLVEVRRDGFGGAEGADNPRRATVSPDGAHVYVTLGSSVAEDGLAVMRRDSATGALTYIEAHRDGVNRVGLTQSVAEDRLDV